MSKKNTRNALMMSALALLLCVSMLVGTTFAWFTDSVQSGTNTITAGNLDIRLFHEDKGGSGEVGSTTKLFDDVTLWEPGAMVYEKLTVENNGSLALKYALTVSISEISKVNGKSLADVLKIAVMDEMPTRENIKTAAIQELATFQCNGTLLANGNSDTYYVAIYWVPSANDNDYNVADEALKATLGVNLVATQMTKEDDSFNNQYDVNAKYPAVSIVTGNQAMTLGVDDAPSAITKKTTVGVPAGAFNDGDTVGIDVTADGSLFNVSANGSVVGALDVVLTVNNVQHETELTGGKVYTVTTFIAKGLTDVSVAYTGTDGRAQPTLVSYNPADGMLVFTTTHFSEYEVSGKAIAYDTVKDIAFTTTDAVVKALQSAEAKVELAGNVEDEVKLELATKVQNAIDSGLIEEDAPALEDVQDALEEVVLCVATADELTAALAAGKSAILAADITMTAPAIVHQDADVVVDLNGHTLNADDATYVLNNLGKLTLKDSVGTGSVNARGIYNGYVADGDKVATATLTIENGVYNAIGPNGGACVYNYGIVEIKSGTFTSKGGYALNTQAGSTMTIKEADVTGGIYNCGDLQIENATVYQHISGRHAIYNWAASLVINGGEFDSISGNELILADGTGASVVLNGGTYNKTAKSWLLGAATGKNITFTINGGTYNGYVNMPEQSVDTIRPYGDPIVVYGGSFNFDPTSWAAEGYKAVKSGDMYMVIPAAFEVVAEGVMKNEAGEYLITNANGLLWMNQQSAVFFGGKTIKLYNDIDCTGFDIKPIYTFDSENPAVFDGQGYTISNMNITSAANNNNQGLFHGVLSIKNVTIDGAYVKGSGYVAVLAGTLYGNIDNCHVKNATVEASFWQVGGLVGMFNSGSITNSSVVDTKIYGPAAVGALAGNVNETPGVRNFTNCVVTGCTIEANGSFGEPYDAMYGAATGLLNVENSTINFDNCKVEGNTVKGAASNALYGVKESSITVNVDGVKQ